MSDSDQNDARRLDELTRSLAGAGATIEAPEAHGLITGAACAGDTEAGTAVLEVLGEGDPADPAWRDARDRLAALAVEIHRTLQSEDFTFQPLLLPDSAPLSRRADSLAQWCQGFLYGLTLAGYGDFSRLPGDLPELMNDFREIAYHFGPDEEIDGASEEEEAYTELVEYVRTGAMLAWTSMRDAASQGSS